MSPSLLRQVLLSFLLLGIWLLLNQTLAPGQIALGAALALLLGWMSTTLRPLRPRVRSLHAALERGGRAHRARARRRSRDTIRLRRDSA